MTDETPKSLDLLGIKSLGDSVNTVAKGAVEGASAFLSRICLPAAEEFGLLLKDRVSHWRTQNLLKVTAAAERKLNTSPDNIGNHAHPRLVSLTLEHGSWAESEDVQEMWGGLLSSSCTPDGKDESNFIFINMLSQLTTMEVRILKHSCEKSTKSIAPAGWISTDDFLITLEELEAVSGIKDYQRLDRELDHLRELGLIRAGFNEYSTDADIAPTSLALHLYVRCQGSLSSPSDYFEVSAINQDQNDT